MKTPPNSSCWSIATIDGYPGQFFVIARRTNDLWYVAGTNGNDMAKSITLDLSFLAGKKGFIITDGKDNRTFRRQDLDDISKEPQELQLRGHGGFVMRLSD